LQATARQKNFLLRAYQGTVRLAHLISELLTISRVERTGFVAQREKFDWEQLMQEVIEDFTAKFKIGDQIEITGEKIGEVFADKNLLRQLLYNLLDNALKYGGKEKIQLACHSQQENGRKILIGSVADQGLGVAPKDIAGLFQPFVRGKNILELDKEGTGLGLYICRLITLKHGGQIFYQPNQPKGSKFTFTLDVTE